MQEPTCTAAGRAAPSSERPAPELAHARFRVLHSCLRTIVLRPSHGYVFERRAATATHTTSGVHRKPKQYNLQCHMSMSCDAVDQGWKQGAVKGPLPAARTSPPASPPSQDNPCADSLDLSVACADQRCRSVQRRVGHG